MPTVFPKRRQTLDTGFYTDRETFMGAVKFIAVAPDGRRVMEAFVDVAFYEALVASGAFERATIVLERLADPPQREGTEDATALAAFACRGD